MTNDDDTTPPSAYALADKIKTAQVRDKMTLRELRRKGWANLQGNDLTTALEHLEGLGWLTVEQARAGSTKGRLSKIIRLHESLIAEQE
jgi:hypothetical protein